TPGLGINGEIQQSESRLVQLVNHETHNVTIPLRDHSDAVSLPKTAEEILFRPRIFETPSFDRQHIGHVTADQPPDLDGRILSLRTGKRHGGLLAPNKPWNNAG